MLSNGTRLVTLTGPGGTGKTRLALQVAAELVGKLHDGVFWISLAGLTDPELLPSEVAQTVGAPDDLTGFLRGREVLFLLDNFEHLLAGAPVVSAVLGACAQVRVLVTSRAPLRVAGEHEYRLEPLPQKQAAALFVERAHAVGREVAPDATVEEICRRLDGLPLAVELAAARTKLLSPERLLERLDSALAVLTSGARDAPERQRTLRATIEWSYDLLEPRSPRAFRPPLGLLRHVPTGGGRGSLRCGPRRSWRAGRLQPRQADRRRPVLHARDHRRVRPREAREGSEGEELRRRHAAFFAALAEQAYDHRFDAEAEWSARLERDHDDLRAALDWLSENDSDRALELAGALGWFWLSRGLLHEGRGRLAAALAASGMTGRSRARALTASGALAARQGRRPQGSRSSTPLWRCGASSATLTSSHRRSTASAGHSSTTPVTTRAHWRRSSRVSSFAGSSATRRE